MSYVIPMLIDQQVPGEEADPGIDPVNLLSEDQTHRPPENNSIHLAFWRKPSGVIVIGASLQLAGEDDVPQWQLLPGTHYQRKGFTHKGRATHMRVHMLIWA